MKLDTTKLFRISNCNIEVVRWNYTLDVGYYVVVRYLYPRTLTYIVYISIRIYFPLSLKKNFIEYCRIHCWSWLNRTQETFFVVYVLERYIYAHFHH